MNKKFCDRKNRVRYKVKKKNLSDFVRLVVHRSSSHIYSQLISAEGKVLGAASTLNKDLAAGYNVEGAAKVGKKIAEVAKGLKIKNLVLDRGGFLYHGKVKALADSVREAGIAI